MWEVEVRARKPYTVYTGKSLLEKTGTILAQKMNPCKAILVADSNVAPLYGKIVEEALRQEGFETVHYVFPAGEVSKSLEELGKLVAFLAEEGVTKTDVVVALGGGVTGDLAGFASSVYLRGVPYVQMPTTVLAAVDSSVGGKTAVNLPQGKNLVGSFYQPKAVICDINTFETLPEKVYSAGLAECIKYGMIKSEPLFSMFLEPKESVKAKMEKIVADCVAMKAEIVQKDEFDEGVRRLLNLGHTAGHAIEACSGYETSHGEAVAVGMLMAARIAEKLRFCSKPCSEILKEALERQGLPTSVNLTPKELAKAALSDKKRKADEIALILPKKTGKCEVYTVRVEELERLFEMGLENG